MSGICSAHIGHDRHCPRCATKTGDHEKFAVEVRIGKYVIEPSVLLNDMPWLRIRRVDSVDEKGIEHGPEILVDVTQLFKEQGS